jgi:hypothetical protein
MESLNFENEAPVIQMERPVEPRPADEPSPRPVGQVPTEPIQPSA